MEKIRILLLLIVIFLGAGSGAFAQIKISGTVTSKENGETIPGANIVIRGTTTGTISGMDGKFNLSVNNRNAVLECSFIGFQSAELSLNGRTEVNFVLDPDVVA
ncbi:carboxypeptidase-like regulatory domain-containing protein, partial [bacterium]|nr:carboxypeptidase-like regulatory domain-containing protein [bacterium]